MAAKLLHSLADDNPDLQKQIGCMTGIFQLFDRHHVISGRRLSQRRLPPGVSHLNNGISEKEAFNGFQLEHRTTASEMNLNKSLNEKHRISTESSRPSFSSSCSSSLSSLDCNKTAQPEASSSDRVIFPETPSRDAVLNQPSTSPYLGRQSLDLRDVVKDSMYREARGLSVRTSTKEEAVAHAVKHKDSPRPVQLTKSVDGSYGIGNKGKQSSSVDLKESLRVLAKLREAPQYYNETRERPRSLHELKDGSPHIISKDAPRFSYDEREMYRLSFESRDTIKSNLKLKDLPRLSLDSREISMRGSNSDSKSSVILKDLQNGVNSNEKVFNIPQSLGTQKRPSNVVARLMGLEALPESASTSSSQSDLVKSFPVEHNDSLSTSSKANGLNRQIRIPKSPRSLTKEPISPRLKNPDLILKPVSRLPIEQAPWKQQKGSRASQKHPKVSAEILNPFPTVYSEIEKRLKNLEFNQSGKDLRALKQILEAMQAKGLLETRKEEQGSNFGIQKEYEPNFSTPNQRPRLLGQRNQQGSHLSAPTTRGSGSSRTYESPIVIMKPAKLVERSGVPFSSVIPIDSSFRLHKIPGSVHAGGKNRSDSNHTAKDQSPGIYPLDSGVKSSDKKASVRSRSTQSSTRPQQLSKENTSSIKSSGSVSPRLQQKKQELEKRSRPPTPPSDPNRHRRQSSRMPTDSGSPGGKNRVKSHKMPQNDDRLSQISTESSHQGDDISLQSDSTVIFDSKTDMEVTSTEQSTEINGSQSPSMKASNHLVFGSKHQKPSSMLEVDRTLAEFAVDTPEHPSPVSVLDAAVYKDDTLSPVKQIPNVAKGDGAEESKDQQGENQWNLADNLISNSAGSGLTSEISRQKLQNIESLVQKLRRLNSTHDEASTDYIASLCENTNPDHRYISEILLASGLLLRDLGSGMTRFQLHSSGHPINPELFFVLEQTKASTLLSEDECSPGKTSHSKPNPERFHRKLIFDAVNEMIFKKLALALPSSEPRLRSHKLANNAPSAQKLLKELCSEIEEHLQSKKSECCIEEEGDGLKGILWDDVMHRSESWIDFDSEVSGIVLDVERSIFKDLVDEIVMGEAAGLCTKPGRRRLLSRK